MRLSEAMSFVLKTPGSYLVAMEFETKNIDKSAGLARIALQQSNKEILFIQMPLKCLQDHIQHSVWVQIKPS